MRGFTYDLLGRMTQAGFGAASTVSPVYDSTIAYSYDAGNRVTQIADSVNGTISRQYDDRFDTVTQETTPQGSVAYSYDAAGRRATMTPSGATQVSYGFDAADRLTGITQGTSMVGLAYDAADRRTTLTLANGVTVSYGYDGANELTELTYRDGSNNLLGDLTYGYDAAGRRVSQGGSFARTGLPDAVTSNSFDANNRASAWNGTALSYDANGNLLGFAGDTYSWDSRDELAGISGTDTASFQYDALGRRQAKTVGGAQTAFLYDGANPVQELSGSTVTANLLTGLGIDEVFARTEGAGTSHYLADALGSTIRLTDASAAKLVDYTYEPYGKTSADAGSTNTFQYTGRENDGTGLYYYRARYMSPVMGRFVSEDPIGLAGGDNIYAYVDGDPVGLVDPYGLDPFDPLWAATYRFTGGWSPSQTTVNAWAGFGNGASFGATTLFNNWAGTGVLVNQCSAAYRYSQIGGNVVGGFAWGGGAISVAVRANKFLRGSNVLLGSRYLRIGYGLPRGAGFRTPVPMLRIGPNPWNIQNSSGAFSPIKAWLTHWRL